MAKKPVNKQTGKISPSPELVERLDHAAPDLALKPSRLYRPVNRSRMVEHCIRLTLEDLPMLEVRLGLPD